MKEKELVAPRSPGALHTPREIQELIHRSAYELFVNRGKEEGHDLDDWILAEAEVMSIVAPEERLHLSPV
jgi:Protein of unknown function (DUF2934)